MTAIFSANEGFLADGVRVRSLDRLDMFCWLGGHVSCLWSMNYIVPFIEAIGTQSNTLSLQLIARAHTLVKCMLYSTVERNVQLCIRNSSFSGHKVPAPGISAQRRGNQVIWFFQMGSLS